jgi:phosphoribosyl 1,2-cyclic phosphodiesterase
MVVGHVDSTETDADAYLGLDDLREWCIRQGAIIPVYLNQATYDLVAASFPYLVDAKFASGGGDV